MGAGPKREVPQGREVEVFGYVTVEEGREDGHAAAYYASAHFSGAARCQKDENVLSMGRTYLKI